MPKVLIDGMALAMKPGQTFAWQLSGGVYAPLQFWEVPNPVANKLTLKLGQEVELVLGSITVKRVIVLGNAPSGDPQTQRVVLTDVRWYWTRAWIARDVNVRRRTGDRRLVGDGPVEVQGNVPDFVFAPYSLDSGAPWRVGAFFADVLNEATAVSRGRPSISWVRESSGSIIEDDRQVEEVFIDDALPAGIARSLNAVPGRDIYVDLEGVVRVYDRMPGAEKRILDAMPVPLEGRGALQWVDMSAHRAAKWRVLFDPEVEVKVTVGGTPGKEDPFGENVLRCPDASLSVSASTDPSGTTRAGRTVAFGTYLTHAEAYVAFGAPTTAVTNTALTDDIVRQGFLGEHLRPNYTLNLATGEVDGQWAARVDEVQNTFRTLIRINPRFMTRVRKLIAKRAAVWDEETGARADSPVFCDHARYPSIRSMAGNLLLGANVVSYNASVASATKAPARINLVDPEQGVFQVVWERDPSGQTTGTAPSAIESVPSLDPASDAMLRAASWSTRKLVSTSTFRLSTILSVVPAAPNNTGRLYPVDVDTLDAAFALGLKFQGQIPEAKGPVQELRVRLVRARVGWQDQADVSNAIYLLLGVSPGDPGQAWQTLVPVNLKSELQPLAKAMAGASLANMLDHYQGTQSVPLDGTLAPIGSCVSVTHTIGENSSETTVQCAAPNPYVDPMALLPSSARKVILREVQP